MWRLQSSVEAALRGVAPKHATVVRAGGLGDTVLVLPALEMVRRSSPDVTVALVGSAWAEHLRPLVSPPVRVVRFDGPEMTPLFAPGADGDPTGAFARADLAVLYTADPRDALVGNARRLCPGRTVSWPVDPPAGRHAAAHFAGAVADTVPEPRDLPPAGLRVSPDLSAWAGEWLAERLPEAAGPVAVHPGSGGRRKCWAPEHFAHLMGALGRPVVLLEGPADAAPCARTAALAGPGAAPARAAGLSVAQTAALLSRCRLYVGNDSGVSHLGAGLGVSTVAVFGPTDPRTWRPLGRRVVSCGGNGAWPDPALVLDACRRLLQPA